MFESPMLDKNTMIFINTFSFYAGSKNNFNPYLTKQEIFYDDKGQPINVAMMNQNNFNYIYDSPNDNFRILFKPLKHEHFSTIVLPRPGYGVAEALKSLNRINDIIRL
ncbi:hypothetical protein RF11_13597 [Thelohanellus kitauei]|uniref:Serpin domain-containing protein n=1 Tax=Thelohanellus kitauei TaxID=669202 RepID=A0A0C2JB10_THEKT|nr:hypothetical protein RF11_13597 [Thelohanellus kitauei]